MQEQNPDSALGVEFFVRPIENPRLSKEKGRKVFEDREYVRIGFPADNKRELVVPANEIHLNPNNKQKMTYAQRFAANYKLFKENSEYDGVAGTPLTELSSISPAKLEELKFQKVRTVEQLAGMPDASIKKLGMGAREIVEEARTYLERVSGQSEIAELKAQIAALQAQTKQAPSKTDEFADYSDDELKAIASDAGVDVQGGWGRAKLIKELRALAEKAKAA